MAAVASQPNPSAYPSQLRDCSPGKRRATRAAKHSSASGRLQRSPPSETAILALHRYINARPSKRHRHRTPASGSQHPSADFSRCRRRSLLTPFPPTHIGLEPSNRLRRFLSHVRKPQPPVISYTLVSRIFHSVQSFHRDHMLSLPSQVTRAQRLSGSHSRSRVVLWRRALLHLPQTVLRKMRHPSCTVEPMPLLGCARPRSPQQGVPRL